MNGVLLSYALVMRLRPRAATVKAIKEVAMMVYDNGGVIRRLSNEGIIRPFRRLRDTSNVKQANARYVTLQADLSEPAHKKLVLRLRDSPDFLTLVAESLEKPAGWRKNPDFFPLDTFTRTAEEIQWSPQVSTDAYDQMDMNWAEFSRTRWSKYLRT